MFERFTELARQVVRFAMEEARALGQREVGPEHILLGLLRGGMPVLEEFGITYERTLETVVRIEGRGEPVETGPMPFSAPAKKALELSLREALMAGTPHIGTEQLLAGLVRDEHSLAIRVLAEMGADLRTIRGRMVIRMGAPAQGEPIRRRVSSGTMLLPAPLISFMFEIRRIVEQGHGRAPDELDYLVALSAVPGGLASSLLAELGIEPERLDEAVARARAAASEELLPKDFATALASARRRLGLREDL